MIFSEQDIRALRFNSAWLEIEATLKERIEINYKIMDTTDPNTDATKIARLQGNNEEIRYVLNLPSLMEGELKQKEEGE